MQNKLHRYVEYACLLGRAAFFVCMALVSQSLFAEDEPKIRVKDTPPPGFEDLVSPQTTEVDVYYGNEKMGNTLATYTPETIELMFPEEVALLIPYLIDAETISKALTGSTLDTHASRSMFI